GPGQCTLSLAAPWGDHAAAPTSFRALRGHGGSGVGGPRPLRPHALSKRACGPRGRHVARRCLHSPPSTALHLVLRLAGAIPLLLPRHWGDLPHLRLRVALFRALASNAVGSCPDLPALYSHSHRGVCAASPVQGGGGACQRRRRLTPSSIRGAISRASGSGAAITRRD